MGDLNLALKFAIVERKKTHNQNQYQIARLARINWTRLSAIVNGRIQANEGEQLRLCGVLEKSRDDLFGSEVTP